MIKLRKAVIPLGGLGTRMLPASKSIPKEILPIVDKPIIHYIVQEAAAAGYNHLVFVTRTGKNSLEDYFDSHFEIEHILSNKGGDSGKILDDIDLAKPPEVIISSIRQPNPKGLGHAILCAEPIVGDEPFAVLLPDVLINKGGQGAESDLKKMSDLFRASEKPSILVEEVPVELVHQYGIVDGEHQNTVAGDSFKLHSMVEKPQVDNAPSNLAIVGRYVLPSSIFKVLQKLEPGAGNEIQLTDAIVKLLDDEEFLGYRMVGKSFDCGSKIGFLKANIHYGLENGNLCAELKSYLGQVVRNFD